MNYHMFIKTFFKGFSKLGPLKIKSVTWELEPEASQISIQNKLANAQNY